MRDFVLDLNKQYRKKVHLWIRRMNSNKELLNLRQSVLESTYKWWKYGLIIGRWSRSSWPILESSLFIILLNLMNSCKIYLLEPYAQTVRQIHKFWGKKFNRISKVWGKTIALGILSIDHQYLLFILFFINPNNLI